MRLTAALVLAFGLFSAEPALAQFRNMGVQFSGGWLGLGNTTDWLNANSGGLVSKWNITDHATLGADYFFFVGYNIRLDSAVVIGGGCDFIGGCTPVFSVAASQGFRYMFLNEKHRPFVSAHIQYLQLIPTGAVNDGVPGMSLPRNPWLADQPFWVGVRGGGGYEWIFAEEQGLEVELGLAGLIGFAEGNFLRPAVLGRVGWNIYF